MDVVPRTKWQRKGRVYIAKLFRNVADTACSISIASELQRQAWEKARHIKFPIGGFVDDAGHLLDDPLMVVVAKPDFDGLGLAPIELPKDILL